ncbi:MAG: NADP-dependent oxidoreductase [Bacteroidales bacterium]
MKTQQIILKERPEGMPKKQNFTFQEVSVPSPQEGEVLIRGKFFSVDPYMRGRMTTARSYVPPYEVGEPIDGGMIGEVLGSKSDTLKEGDWVWGMLPWQKEQVVTAESVQKIDPNLAPPQYFLGILGLTGITAYFGLLDIGKPQKGETVVVSAAAGAVGMVVGQIAKLKGCHVVGIAGSPEKVDFLKHELGFDEAFNYKAESDLRTAIQRTAPKGVDVYFDNVGGPISDAVIQELNPFSRIPLCGQISLYNETSMPTGPRIQPRLLKQRTLIKGFIVRDYLEQADQARQQLAQWLKEGKIKNKETLVDGFEKLPEAFIGLFHGENTGKLIVKV